MDQAQTEKLVKQLAAGFEALQEEYEKLFGQHQALERKLATAREQYNELAKLCGSGELATPPLSLTSSPGQKQLEATIPGTVPDILEQRTGSASKDAASTVRAASKAAICLQRQPLRPPDTFPNGVKIWSGPSADMLEASSSIMPSISESPLEQDFTIEGKPSSLGCPFASMANKKLSSHAASVLSRYNQGSSAAVASSTHSSANRVNGRESLARRSDRRASFMDPIKAEICGLSDHQQDDHESPLSERAMKEHVTQQESDADVGVCPIRFLDQHSPEEVATYFEKHKHELPRSHEVCVKRYQSNEKQIRELDAKYGNLVSMIQGLGAKHQDYLPKEPDDGGAAEEEESKRAEQVRQWASSVSVQPGRDGGDEDHVEEHRQPHFERPLRDIRVGESPSRPWGIQVPAKYLEKAGSESSTRPAEVKATPANVTEAKSSDATGEHANDKSRGRCPFGFDKSQAPQPKEGVGTQETSKAEPAFVASERKAEQSSQYDHEVRAAKDESARMVFTGPVFIGYNAEDAAKILRKGGLGATSY